MVTFFGFAHNANFSFLRHCEERFSIYATNQSSRHDVWNEQVTWQSHLTNQLTRAFSNVYENRVAANDTLWCAERTLRAFYSSVFNQDFSGCSLRCRPPSNFLAREKENVECGSPFPPNLGGTGTRVDVVFFYYSVSTGGSTPT